MNEKTQTPIERITALLAEMTERAVETERQIDAAKEEAVNWYQLYKDKHALLEGVSKERDALLEDNKKLRNKIEEYIETIEKGAQNNA